MLFRSRIADLTFRDAKHQTFFDETQRSSFSLPPFRLSPAFAHRRGKQSSNETSNESNLIIIQNGAKRTEEETGSRGGGEPVAEEGYVPSFEE